MLDREETDHRQQLNEAAVANGGVERDKKRWVHCLAVDQSIEGADCSGEQHARRVDLKKNRWRDFQEDACAWPFLQL